MPFIESPRFPGRNAHSTDLFQLLGQPGTKWPAEGLPPRLLQGIKVWVTPAQPKFRRGWNGYAHVQMRVKSSTHRVMCECPSCGQVLSVGRLHQHLCVKGTGTGR